MNPKFEEISYSKTGIYFSFCNEANLGYVSATVYDLFHLLVQPKVNISRETWHSWCKKDSEVTKSDTNDCHANKSNATNAGSSDIHGIEILWN